MNKANEMIKELSKALQGFELLRRWGMKHHNLVVDFFNLDFEKIDTKILADEAKELEETTTIATVGGTNIAKVGTIDPGQKDGATAPVVE
nr:hypothetical protein CFP56_60162 [Quercus suber]